MKKLLYLFFSVTILLSCADDLGNYEYHEPEDPIVSGLVGQTFVGYVGDSLIIEPTIEHSLLGTDQLEFDWEIANHVDLRGEFYEGESLRMLFNLKPELYMAKLTITNHSNEMKYFYNFKIEARTEFSSGTIVLSNEGGVGKLSFIKGGNSLRANIYEGLHGEDLPMDPRQILIVDHAWLKAYHIVTGEADRPGVILDASTMIRKKYLSDNFFDAPGSIHAEALTTHPAGVSTGVFNGKLYCGQWQTCPCSPIHGIYGGAAPGDYQLSPSFIFDGSHYLGYDVNKKKLVQFDINLGFQGDSYQVIPMGEGNLFDPKNMNVELLTLNRVNAETTYAFGRDAEGKIYEYKFQDVPGLIFPKAFREFPGASLILADTKWQASQFEVFYFTSGDKVYRYNPVNQEVRLLDADFKGKAVTMIKLIDEDLLIAGTEGSIHYLDVSTGKNGSAYKVIDNIPGTPVDVVVRK